MATAVTKKHLKSVLRRHLIWLEDQHSIDGERADLEEACFISVSLSCANLQKANLRKANLSCANLQGADLRGADLREALLSASNLENANLQGADLSYAKLDAFSMKEASFKNATLDGALLKYEDAYSIFSAADNCCKPPRPVAPPTSMQVPRSPSGRHKITQWHEGIFLFLYRHGKTAEEIAAYFNVGVTTVKYYFKKFKCFVEKDLRMTVKDVVEKQRLKNQTHHGSYLEIEHLSRGRGSLTNSQKIMVVDMYRHGIPPRDVATYLRVSVKVIYAFYSELRQKGIAVDCIDSVEEILRRNIVT